MVVITHDPAPVVSAEKRRLVPNGRIGYVAKNTTPKKQTRLRCGDVKVKVADAAEIDSLLSVEAYKSLIG